MNRRDEDDLVRLGDPAVLRAVDAFTQAMSDMHPLVQPQQLVVALGLVVWAVIQEMKPRERPVAMVALRAIFEAPHDAP